MNPTLAPKCAGPLAAELQQFHALCEEALALVARESRALADPDGYNSVEFNQLRKCLLPRLESGLIQLRKQRQIQRQIIHSESIANLFETIQSVVMKFLQLDRENQQSLLRRGLVPPRHLPAVAAQQPHYVAGLYRRHAQA